MASPIALLAAAVALVAATTPLAAQSLNPGEQLSSMTVRAVTPPDPVAGSDGLTHFAYELFASNVSDFFLTVDRVALIDPAGKTVASRAGPALAAMMTVYHGSGATLAPGGNALILLDAAFDGVLPATLTARITLTRQVAGDNGQPKPMPTNLPIPATFTFDAATVVPGKSPGIIIAPPLRGSNWLASNGCCDSKTPHRGAVMAINGELHIAQRFAIDWVQLATNNRLFNGPVGNLASYAYFGTPVHAVADGTVVNLYDSATEQVPGAPAKGITPANIGGNMLVIDIGGGNFAFFAHLQPGSLNVKLGDKVKTGDVIALLGNTGNSDGPHLHFHVMDGPSPLDSNGLPYVFTRFTGLGVMNDASSDALWNQGTAPLIDRSKLTGVQIDRLPLNNQIVDFGE